MDFLEFFQKSKAQEQIDKLAKKYKNRKIVLYGAGIYARSLTQNYDLSKLPVIGISDRKFSNEDTDTCFGYKTIKPEELKNLDFDLLIVTAQDYNAMKESLEDNTFYNTQNEGIKIIPIIKKSFWQRLIEIIEE